MKYLFLGLKCETVSVKSSLLSISLTGQLVNIVNKLVVCFTSQKSIVIDFKGTRGLRKLTGIIITTTLSNLQDLT